MRRLTAEQIEELRLELHEVESELESELDEMASDLGETKVALQKAWRERDAALAQAKVDKIDKFLAWMDDEKQQRDYSSFQWSIVHINDYNDVDLVEACEGVRIVKKKAKS